MRVRLVSLLRVFLLISFLQFLCTLTSPAEAIGSRTESSSVSGKIGSVSDNELTLFLGRNQTSGKLAFVLDSNTKIEGKPMIGALASVDYRAEGERLIATRVVVTPTSGMQEL